MKKQLVFYCFLADWCNGSRIVKPIIKDECSQLKQSYKLIDVDTEQGANLSVKYGINNVPAIVAVNQYGEVVDVAKGNECYKIIAKYAKKKWR
jgi:thioredoxin-like negative regulator of GroEL